MSSDEEIWVIDDDRSIRWVLEKALAREGLRVVGFETGEGVFDRLAVTRPGAIISDIRMPGVDGLSLLKSINERHPDLPVVIMTAYSDLDSTVSAYQGGAFEYLPKPFDIDDAVELVRRALMRKRAPGEDAGAGEAHHASERHIIGSAPAMQDVFRAIGRLSRSNITVLITGESGTGKELVARALHRHSPRATRSFVALNTAAIPRELLESELFGHERGAFTGAQSQRRGRFEQADGGTLFLDEIGDMPPDLQTRLLRVLAEGEFFRVGGHVPLRVDVRVIAATHQDLANRVREGLFREDLFHRLNVIRVHVPALRERSEDIPALLDHFLGVAARELHVERKRLHAETIAHLMHLEWPGNVRELENTCRWLTVMAPGDEIGPEDLPPELRAHGDRSGATDDWEAGLRRWAEQHLAAGGRRLLDLAVPRFERVMIETALEHAEGRRQDAARLLGWGRNTLTRKIKEHRMNGLADGGDDTDRGDQPRSTQT
ncbi:MAG: nitrogen regulation protein NR(I) [Gammaproteobacteria bacterium]|nr:nitrogen regulation protein NR(I) [Gammaproteobacteria bacterium]NIR83307.1 nitrogen regulation protein NR(I) [Gammaproteobacteria bacterium]NIR91107.1 nitrogen regulation protein NR(I) [Gammaproteobacteria bacterium]NIU04474.1 nitrogen regulation protein NR(I) [Gammaproteobacteria bacterium]NIW87110.1 nitrogen regulation protein NR(I) [Gammaproteobacteria bacterium]